MNKRNTAIGIVLILLGVSIYLRNFHIGTGSLVTMFLGLGLLFAYFTRKEQPFIIFGGIFTAIGLASVLGDLRFFRIDMTFESVLIALGLIFIIIFYSKKIQGFIFPGAILVSTGIYLILLRSFNDRLAGPSIFFLLGLAFYAIYFMAYMGSSSWPLIPATLLMGCGILAYAFSFELITWDRIFMEWDYIWPLLMVLAGVLILLSKIRKKKQTR